MATKRRQKIVEGMRGMWVLARRDLVENSRGLKQDVKDILEAARASRRVVKDTKVAALIELTNPDAGAELLTHFKEEWAAIHSEVGEASQTVTKMDSQLEDINKSLARSHSIITNCCDEFRMLPDTLKAFETAQEKVSQIGELLKEVEDSIVECGRVKAQLEAERKRQSVKIQSDKHREQLEVERKRLEGILAEEHCLSEKRQRELEVLAVQERQQAFQEIFDQQMAEYREHGEVERPIGSELRERTDSQLESVVIEDADGTASLHEFLSDIVMEDLGTEGENQLRKQNEEGEESRDQSYDKKEGSHDLSHDQKQDEEEIFHDAPES